MAEQVTWSIIETGTNSSVPPSGLSCALDECGCTIALFIQDSADADAAVLDDAHPDVPNISEYRGKKSGVLLVKLLQAEYLGPDWRFIFEYNESAVLSGLLAPRDISSAECMTPELQAKIASESGDFSVGDDYIDFVAGAALDGHRAIHIDSSGEAVIADPSLLQTCRGILRDATGDGGTARVYHSGVVNGFGGLSEGSTYFLGAGGMISLTPHPDFWQPLGSAVTETEFLIDIEDPIHT